MTNGNRKSDRRPIGIVIVILTIAVGILAAKFTLDPKSASQPMDGWLTDSSDNLPQDITLLASTNDGTVSGKVISRNAETGEAFNVMIYDETSKHLVAILPNEKYDELSALVGST